MSNKREVYIGLMGLGTVGSGVAKVLHAKSEAIASQAGSLLKLKKVLVRDLTKRRLVDVPHELLTTDANEILQDAAIDIVVEVMGGEYPAGDYVQRAIASGKHVVTANKELIAKRGPELLREAQEHGVEVRFEASVGGGIPLIAPFQEDLAANRIISIEGIINGTTNYILTQMALEGTDFEVALKQAQELGYAEADPTNDIEGIDASYKIAILAMLGFHRIVRPENVYTEGITRLSARDFRYARELGYAIKLLAIAKDANGALQVRVHPALVADDLLLAKVDGVFNAIQVDGDLVGRVLFYGRGAGSEPTTSAIVADMIALTRSIGQGTCGNRVRICLDEDKPLQPMSDVETRYYFRMQVADRPGVLAKIAQIFGEHQISIASFIQKESDELGQTAEIVIMTHTARESAVQEALREIRGLPVVSEIGNFIRVEG